LRIRDARGFTLVELLVVIAILSILSAVGIPMYSGYVQGARDKEAQVVLRSIAAAQETYRIYNRTYFTSTCDEGSAAKISEKLLSGNRLNTNYFNYCTSLDSTVSKPNFIVTAINKLNGKEFRLDQDSNEFTIINGVQRTGF